MTFKEIFETLGGIPSIYTLFRFAADLRSKASETLVKEGLEQNSKLWPWQRNFKVEFKDFTTGAPSTLDDPRAHNQKRLALGGAALAVTGLGAAALVKSRRNAAAHNERQKPPVLPPSSKKIKLNCHPTNTKLVFVRGTYGTKGNVESVFYMPKDVRHDDGSLMSLCSQYSTWLHHNRRISKQTLHEMRSDIELRQSGETLYFYKGKKQEVAAK